MTSLPAWAHDGLHEHAPPTGASEASRARFDVLRARVERASAILATEVAPALEGVSDAGKRAVFAQAVWAAKYFGVETEGTQTARDALREAARLGDEIRARLDELATTARQHALLMADHALTGCLPAIDDCLEGLRRTHPEWALVSGLARVLDVSRNTSQQIPEFVDVIEALAAADFDAPCHFLGDALASRKATADRTRVLLHALARLANHPHLPADFRLSNIGVAGLARVVFGGEVDAETVRKLRLP